MNWLYCLNVSTCYTGNITPRRKVADIIRTFTHLVTVLSVKWIYTFISTFHPCESSWTFCGTKNNFSTKKDNRFKALSYVYVNLGNILEYVLYKPIFESYF